MKRKNRNRNTQQKATPSQTPIRKVATEDDKKEIEELKASTDQDVKESGITPASLNSTEEKKYEKAEKDGEFLTYLNYVRSINQNLNALLVKNKKKETEIEEKSTSLKKQIEEAEKNKNEYNTKLEELNNKKKEVLKRELQIDNGEYTETICSLLNALDESAKDIGKGTKEAIDYLNKKFQQAITNVKDDSYAEFNWTKKNKELELREKRIERKERNIDEDKKVLEEEIEEKYKDKYEEELCHVKSRAEILSIQNERLNKEIEDLKKFKMDINKLCADSEPEALLKELHRLKGENKKLQEELVERPTQEDLNGKQSQIDFLKAEYEKKSDSFSEKELLELRKRINNSDAYIIDIQRYKERLETTESHVKSIELINEELRKTIDQLTENNQKDKEAFQFAHRYDEDPELQEKRSFRNEPISLVEFANYMQRKIASSPKPFYYDIDTIRTFIAGLNMSNITILQGISGTGKTSLPREFAKCIISDSEYNGNGEDNSPKAPYRICAVQSGWRDNMDLMGYYNSFEHKYKETEFFKALYLANLPKYSDTLFFIILDEMNLSRPEYYFADFLSLLEQNEDERYIAINAPEEVLPSLIKGGKLRVPKNVRFIGTANHDETTLEFAPKTYDRSNLMEMPRNPRKDINMTNDNYNVSYSWLNDQFKEAEKSNDLLYKMFKEFINSDNVKRLLDEKEIGIGNRFEDQARRFICTFIATGNNNNIQESQAKAADHLIATRLFRKLRNRYELDKSNLQSFKESFDTAFRQAYRIPPTICDKMLEDEIRKK